MRSFHKYSGFTLVEVLISATILFMVIAVSSLAFEQLILTRNKVVKVATYYQFLPLLKPSIIEQVESNRSSGELEIHGRRFVWDSIVLQKKPAILSLGAGSGDVSYTEKSLVLLEISVSEKGGGTVMSYKDLAWLG